MTIRIPFVPIEFEISARRRTAPFRVRVRTLMITVAVVAVIVYLSLPFSAADQQLMTRYEQLGNGPSKDGLTKDQVISQIGRPSSAGIPGPKHCFEYNWEAQFDRPLSHVEYRLGVSIDPDTGDVLAWGPLDKTEYQGLDLVWYRLGGCLRWVRLNERSLEDRVDRRDLEPDPGMYQDQSRLRALLRRDIRRTISRCAGAPLRARL